MSYWLSFTNTTLLKFAQVPASNVHYPFNWRDREALLCYSGQLSTYIVPNKGKLQILINYNIIISVIKKKTHNLQT